MKKDRRQYQRESLCIPLEIKIIPIEKQAELMSKVSGSAVVADFGGLTNFKGKKVIDWLTSFQEHFDAMVNAFRQMSGPDDFSVVEFTDVNISGGGAKFFTKTKCNQHDIVELKVMLPQIPPIPLYIYGEILRASELDNGYTVAVKFIALNDDIRNEIVTFITTLLR